MRTPAVRAAWIGAVLAVVLTLTARWWAVTRPASVFADLTLSWGIIFASLPFGGLHNDPPFVLVYAVGLLLNALLWGLASAGLARLWRRRSAT